MEMKRRISGDGREISDGRESSDDKHKRIKTEIAGLHAEKSVSPSLTDIKSAHTLENYLTKELHQVQSEIETSTTDHIFRNLTIREQVLNKALIIVARIQDNDRETQERGNQEWQHLISERERDFFSNQVVAKIAETLEKIRAKPQVELDRAKCQFHLDHVNPSILKPENYALLDETIVGDAKRKMISAAYIVNQYKEIKEKTEKQLERPLLAIGVLQFYIDKCCKVGIRNSQIEQARKEFDSLDERYEKSLHKLDKTAPKSSDQRGSAM